MKEQHIILKSISSSTNDVFLGKGKISNLVFGASIASHEISNAINQLNSQSLSIEVKEIDRNSIPSITRDSDVQAIAPSILMKLVEPFEVNSTPEAITQGMAWGIKAIGADTSPFSGEGISVAVLDTGINAAHPTFSGLNIIQKDFTGEGDGDQNGHGTFCAATICGKDIDGTRIGIARGIKQLLIGKVLDKNGSGSSQMIAHGIQWAVEQGANVVSMSLGIDFTGVVKLLINSGIPVELATSRALEGYRANVQLFERLASLIKAQSAGGFSQPAILIAAAGNESKKDLNPNFEVEVSPPGVSEGFISVAALGQGSQGLVDAPFSNSGASISAPGVAILSANMGGGLRTLSGTSMATPHVAGVAALWAEKLKKNTQLNSLLLTSKLLSSGVTDGLQSGLKSFEIGAGLVRAPQN